MTQILRRNKKADSYRITENFTVGEMKCKCGRCELMPSLEFVQKLQTLRNKYGFPMVIRSAARCPDHNTYVGGAPNSMHKQARAVDVEVLDDRERRRFVRLAMQHGWGGIGVYDTYVHIDDRDDEIMWGV